ncbi:hypothetical protein GGI07_001615 [Coemansia sp. Benny D115]|nr:hypothetical protein GGI07_001615 [Coemansia sp. Benny D115]
MSDTSIVELETLRRQLQQLYETFSTIVEETRPTPDNPMLVSWPDLLSKFNILAAKYAILGQAVNKKHAALLKEMAVAPTTKPGNIQEQTIVSVLLRTKLAPEIEQEEEEIWAHVEQEMAQSGRRIDWSARAERHEGLAVAALNAFLECRREHASVVDGLVAKQMDVDMEDAREGAAGGSETEVALEDVLAFMSSGVEI